MGVRELVGGADDLMLLIYHFGSTNTRRESRQVPLHLSGTPAVRAGRLGRIGTGESSQNSATHRKQSLQKTWKVVYEDR